MIWNAFLLAFREIRRNLMRSILTMLGIIIGVASVITMVTIGNGATAKVTQEIASLGSNLLSIRPGQRMGPRREAGAISFTQEDVDAIRAQIVSLRAIAPNVNASVTAIYSNENWSTSVVGSNNDYFVTGNWQLTKGRQFTADELAVGKPSCIVGNTIIKELLADVEPLNKKLRLNSFSCEIIGVLASKGQSMMGNDQDDVIILPLKTVQRKMTGSKDIRSITIAVKPNIDSSIVSRSITLLLRERRHLSANEKDNFSVRDTEEITKALTGTTKVMTMLLSAVAGVSLIVGGIGIMNIMLVSVIERTREIGIRMAIGAMEKEVLLQFLVEAVVISSLGGLIGILLAIIVSAMATTVMAIPYVLDLNIIALAFLFSAMIGVVFGYFPAKNAARLNPIDALRH